MKKLFSILLAAIVALALFGTVLAAPKDGVLDIAYNIVPDY